MLNLGPKRGGANILKFASIQSAETSKVPMVELKDPLFVVLYSAIHNIRGLESISHNIQYNSPRLDLLASLSEKPLQARLIDFLNSWDVISIHEEHLKEFFKAYLIRNINRGHEDLILRDMLEALRGELLGFYSEEAVGSLIFTLETASTRSF